MSQTAHQFTPEQIANFKKYEKVRKSGRFNMFDPNARQATGLPMGDYTFVMKNFTPLRAAAES